MFLICERAGSGKLCSEGDIPGETGKKCDEREAGEGKVRSRRPAPGLRQKTYDYYFLVTFVSVLLPVALLYCATYSSNSLRIDLPIFW